MKIRDILLIIIIIYVVYLHSKINTIKNRENFAVTDDIKAVVKEIYNTDMESVRQLAAMTDKLLKGGLEILGNLKVTGNLEVSGTINSSGDINSSSAINSSGNIQSKGEIKTIDTKNNNEKASLNSITSINSSITSINTSLDSKIDNNASISLEDVARPTYKLSTGTTDEWIPFTWDKQTRRYGWSTRTINYKWKISKIE